MADQQMIGHNYYEHMITVYEMQWNKDKIPGSEIDCIPFDESFAQQYMESYNDAFYPMRKVLDIKPYNWYSEKDSFLSKAKDIFLLTDHDELIGSVACYGNEIDDLFVCSKYRHLGYGRELLIWAMNHIQEHCDDSIILHVAAWNEHAVQMYKDSGFVIVKTEQVVS